MALSLRRDATAELSTELRLPGDGRRSLRHSLLGGCASSGTRMAYSCGRSPGQSARSHWARAPDLERVMAGLDFGPFDYERHYLVDSLLALFI